MRGSGAKIIIKPRRSRQAEISQEPESEPSENVSDEQEDIEQPDEDVINDDADSQKDAEDNASDDNDVDAEPVRTPRGRGRPRGRPPGRGVGRPRGRPRGSGRGRGRGRGRGSIVTLKLSRRGADSDVDTGVEGEDSQGATPAVEDRETAEAIAGGKPYRMVQDKVYVLENDELVTDEDEKGNTKIDEHGNLLGGRVFRAQTFVLPNRHPERRYMLAIDAARTSGFRDSLYYFRRNPLALKLNASQIEKDYLIEQGKLGGHLRTRSVTLITARSAYKLHGAKTIVGGRLVVDDYYEDKALADITERGLKPGDPVEGLIEQQQQAVAEASGAGKDRSVGNKNERSGLGIYRTGGPTTVFGGMGLGPFSDGPINVAKKAMLSREGVTEENWMHVMAERTREANGEWTKGRKESFRPLGGLVETRKEKAMEVDGEGNKEENEMYPLGVFEPHSFLVHYRDDSQATRARWECLPDSKERRRVLGGTKVGNGAWALAWVDTVMELPVPEDEEATARRALSRTANFFA